MYMIYMYMYMYVCTSMCVGVTGKTYIAHNALTRKSALIWAAAASVFAAFGSDAAKNDTQQSRTSASTSSTT